MQFAKSLSFPKSTYADTSSSDYGILTDVGWNDQTPNPQALVVKGNVLDVWK